ncbi:MAG TPA: YjbQ family protein [Bacteroidales bacterium]|nr:YjbQ family protein [Bacteroidales bacterium]
MIKTIEIQLPPFPQGYHLITDVIVSKVKDLPQEGILHLFLRHTSAAISLNENADSSVRNDFSSFFCHLVPEDFPNFTHTMEGSDDMPAHIKSSIIGVQLSIPIYQGKLGLGTWQGIYLCEFRRNARGRKLLITVQS